MRDDLLVLVEAAKAGGLQVELHTNAVLIDRIDATALFSLLDRLGLSLDGEDAETHDRMRGTSGNFHANLRALRLADAAQLPTTIRTLVTRKNKDKLCGLPGILEQHESVRKWSLRQFAPLGRGAKSRKAYELTTDAFKTACGAILSQYGARQNKFEISVISESEMTDCFCLITEDGIFYSHPHPGDDYSEIARFPNKSVAEIGNILVQARINSSWSV